MFARAPTMRHCGNIKTMFALLLEDIVASHH
jgi:hypothetical protein